MRHLSLLFVLLLPTLVLAQAESSFLHNEGHVLLTLSTPLAVGDFFPAFAKTLRTDAHTTWAEKRVTKSDEPTALSHHRFAQEIDNIPVLGATIILHANNGEVQFATGKSYPRQTSSSTIRISEAEATRNAANEFSNWAKRQQLHPIENDFTGRPLRVDKTLTGIIATAETPRLVFLDRQYPRYTGSLLLAYEIEIGHAASRRAMYIDVRTGKLITSIPLVAHSTVPGTVETAYYGVQNVMVEQDGPSMFRLADSSRGVFVRSLAVGGDVTNSSADFGLLSVENSGMANDVFYGSSRFYDLLEDKFGWLGVDGQGEFFESDVWDTSGDLVNAFWTGERATFGGGNCHFDPLTTLDVVGHEFAHGITQRTSNLVYSGQSGALNEGMSDIYGKALELYEQPDQFNWTLGNRFADSEYATPFRSMADPNIYNKPKVVGGMFWNDGAGVHTNSGPLGHWFYLLNEGGVGVNDLGTSYNVQPVSLDIAFNVAFQLNRDFLTETSDYQDAFTNCMMLVETLYGVNSDEYETFAEAWKAIGLPTTGTNPPTGLDLAIFSFNSNRPRYCHPDDSVQLRVVLSNRGDDVSAGTSYTLTADINDEMSVVTKTFDEDFLKGEIDFMDVIFPMQIAPGEYRAAVTVDIAGDIQVGNNTGSQTAYVFQAPHVIEIDGFNLEELDCFADEREITLNLLNRGCETFTGPVVIDLLNADDNVVKTINAGNITLTPEQVEFVSFSVLYAELEGVTGIQYEVANDPLPEDNVVTGQMGRPRLLTSTGRIEFSSADASRYVALDNSRGHLGKVTQNGREWLGTTGNFTTPFRLSCFETEINLERVSDVSALEMCVDFESEAIPKLAFDLKQLHGDGDPLYPGLRDVNRGVSIKTSSFTFPTIYLDSRADGITNPEEIELPANHKGLVRFTFYNAAGSPTNWETSDPDFEEYDYTFIDNLRLAGVVDTQELSTSFSIKPNPARGFFTIVANSNDQLNIEVINSIGVHVAEHALHSRHTISTENWPNGIYHVRVSDQTGAQRTEQLLINR